VEVGGERLEASAVISGVALPYLVQQLVGREHLPRPYLDAMDAQGCSLSVLALGMGLDCLPSQVGVDTHITAVFPGADLDACFRDPSAGGVVRGYSLTAHANSDPAIASEAARSLSLVSGADPKEWCGLGKSAYAEKKKRTVEGCLEQVERRFPGLASHVESSDLATPSTMMHYTQNPGGAIMGFACRTGDHRTLLRLAAPPIRGLFLAGAWTDKLGGMMQVLKAGEAAAGKAAPRGWKQ
jgi:prolycopene isomerase